MKIDVHVHIIASTAEHGKVSRYLRKRPNVILSRLLLGIPLSGPDDTVEAAFERCLVQTVEETPELDAAVGLAFDAVHTEDGRRDESSTHLYISNDYAAGLARANPKLLFGASVHPYRFDAVAELEACAAAGAVLVKWLPLVQGMDPASDRCTPFYEALAHHRLPLLCHTGGELSLPQHFPQYASPELLIPALRRGVTAEPARSLSGGTICPNSRGWRRTTSISTATPRLYAYRRDPMPSGGSSRTKRSGESWCTAATGRSSQCRL